MSYTDSGSSFHCSIHELSVHLSAKAGTFFQIARVFIIRLISRKEKD